MTDIIHDLQKKPYAVRVKILRIILVVVAIVVIIIWAVTIRFRNVPQNNTSKFNKLWQSIKNIKELLPLIHNS